MIISLHYQYYNNKCKSRMPNIEKQKYADETEQSNKPAPQDAGLFIKTKQVNIACYLADIDFLPVIFFSTNNVATVNTMPIASRM